MPRAASGTLNEVGVGRRQPGKRHAIPRAILLYLAQLDAVFLSSRASLYASRSFEISSLSGYDQFKRGVGGPVGGSLTWVRGFESRSPAPGAGHRHRVPVYEIRNGGRNAGRLASYVNNK
jgi:hypothetical protein